MPVTQPGLLAECCAHHDISTQKLRAAAAALEPLEVPRPDLEVDSSINWRRSKCAKLRKADLPRFFQDEFGDTTVSARAPGLGD